MTFRIALALILLAPTAASALSGSAQLSGRSKLTVHGCGRMPATFVGALVVRDDGTWSATSDGPTFVGTYTAVGRSGRKIALQVGDPAAAVFAFRLTEDVSALCDTAVRLTSLRSKVLTLTLNRKRTKAKLAVRYVVRGTNGERSGTATFALAAHGAWSAI